MRALLLCFSLLSACAASDRWVGDHVYTPPICQHGLADCDGRSSTGCETRVESDRANCGTCAHACPSAEVCDHGTCISQ